MQMILEFDFCFNLTIVILSSFYIRMSVEIIMHLFSQARHMYLLIQIDKI